MSRLHTNFVEVKVHTAKCDSCETHNKGTLYRCTECGQHVCSFCWVLQSGDKTHVYGSGSHNADGKQEDEKEGTRQARIRRTIVISDDEDDDLPMLTPVPTTNPVEMNGTTSQQRDGRNAIIDNDHRVDHQDDLSTLRPIAQARKLPVLKPADPTVNTRINDTVDQLGRRHSHIQGQRSRAGRHEVVQDYDSLERQAAPTRHAFVNDDQKLARQAHLPSSSEVPRQQALYPTLLQVQPTSFHQQPRDNLAAQNPSTFTNIQAAQRKAPDPIHPQVQPASYQQQLRDNLMARNQYAFAKTQSAQRQAPDHTHSLNAHQRATQLAFRQTQHPSYRPRPGVNVPQQATRGQFVSADGQDVDHHNRRPNHQSFSRQGAVPPDSRPAQASIPRQNAQMAANIDAVAAHNRHAFLIDQQAQARARAMSMEARNRQAMGVYRTLPQDSSGDQVRQKTFASKQQPPSTRTSMEQNMTARDQQEAGLSQNQANRPHPGPPQTPYHYQGPTKSSPLSPQVSLSKQHAALPASRQAPNPAAIQKDPERPSGIHQVREHSPGVLAAADALLACARTDQNSDAYDHQDQDLTAFSQLTSAAGQPSKARSVSFKSPASPKTLTGESGAADIQHVGGPGLSSYPLSADADSSIAHPENNRDRQAGWHTSSGTHKPVSDPSISPPDHPSYSRARLQCGPRSILTDSSAAQSPGLPVSNHAATYLRQWNSGRAAHSLSQSPQLHTACSSSSPLQTGSTPAIHNINVGARDSIEAAGARTEAPRGPDCALGGPSGMDIVTRSPDVREDDSRRSEALALEEMRRKPRENAGSEETRFPEPTPSLIAEGRAKKHQRDEKKADRNISKKHKASGNVDVVDPWGRNTKASCSGQIDDNGGDIENTLRNKRDSSRTTTNKRQANAVPKGLEHLKNYKKGVAYPKKPEPQGRKGKKG
ncbi:hypothetical protein BDR22DRAFT_818745 [Usnea florida]